MNTEQQARISSLMNLLEIYRGQPPKVMVPHVEFLIAMEVIDELTAKIKKLEAQLEAGRRSVVLSPAGSGEEQE
jgi:hypothetical protein